MMITRMMSHSSDPLVPSSGVYVTLRVSVALLPAGSIATTVMVFPPSFRVRLRV
jgi:hypothetical protein